MNSPIKCKLESDPNFQWNHSTSDSNTTETKENTFTLPSASPVEPESATSEPDLTSTDDIQTSRLNGTGRGPSGMFRKNNQKAQGPVLGRHNPFLAPRYGTKLYRYQRKNRFSTNLELELLASISSSTTLSHRLLSVRTLRSPFTPPSTPTSPSPMHYQTTSELIFGDPNRNARDLCVYSGQVEQERPNGLGL